MGTNYYARTDACPHCGRSDGDIHICKSLTIFRGYLDTEWAQSPVGRVTSWQDWKRILREKPVRVFDEYGTEHPIEDFIARVEATEPSARRRQYDWMQEHDPANTDDWLDVDGFSFCSREFS